MLLFLQRYKNISNMEKKNSKSIFFPFPAGAFWFGNELFLWG